MWTEQTDPPPTEGLALPVCRTSEMHHQLSRAAAEIRRNNNMKRKGGAAIGYNDRYYVHLVRFDINYDRFDVLVDKLSWCAGNINKFRLSVSRIAGLHDNKTIVAEVDQQDYLRELYRCGKRNLGKMPEVGNLRDREDATFYVTLVQSAKPIPKSTWEDVRIAGVSPIQRVTLLSYTERNVREDGTHCQEGPESHTELVVSREHYRFGFETDEFTAARQRPMGMKNKPRKSPYFHFK